jgi:predicted PhzF superfamily epimerase YddE/YHI9
LGSTYLAAQGTSIGRVGRVTVRPDSNGIVWIGGQVHILIEGNLNL